MDPKPDDVLLEPNQEEDSDQVESKESKASEAFCWLLQIIDWGLILVSIIVGGAGYDVTIPVILFGVAHFIYVILEMCCPFSDYLCQFNSEKNLSQYLGEFFKSQINHSVQCENYHYEYVTEKKRIKGKTKKITTTKRMGSSDAKGIPIYSCRDISGVFNLNCPQDKVGKIKLVRLELDSKLYYADAVSYMDYKNIKDTLIANNKNLDKNFHFNESSSIPFLGLYHMSKIGDEKLSSVSCCLFFLFTLISCGEIYKCYVNSMCVYQKFVIKKLISTRYDLSQPEYEEKYKAFNPQVNTIEKVYNYQKNEYNYKNPFTEPKLPTPEELEKAKEFEKETFEYKYMNSTNNKTSGDADVNDNKINPEVDLIDTENKV